MSLRREPPTREVTPEFVEWLRGVGASDDLVEFADDHAKRYSRVEYNRGVRFVCLLAMLGFLVWFLAGVMVGAQFA